MTLDILIEQMTLIQKERKKEKEKKRKDHDTKCLHGSQCVTHNWKKKKDLSHIFFKKNVLQFFKIL